MGDKFESKAIEYILNLFLDQWGSQSKMLDVNSLRKAIGKTLRVHYDKSPPPPILDAPDGPGWYWCDVKERPEAIMCRYCKWPSCSSSVYYSAENKCLHEYPEPRPGRYQRIPDPVWPESEKLPHKSDVPMVRVETGFGLGWAIDCYLMVCDRCETIKVSVLMDGGRVTECDLNQIEIIPHPDNAPELVRQIEEAKK